MAILRNVEDDRAVHTVKEKPRFATGRDYAMVKSYLERLGAPFYDRENQRPVNSTPILDVTDILLSYFRSDFRRRNKFYLKEEYRNPLTRSVKGRAVASMVLEATNSGSVYATSGKKKRWIEPTSGNTGKGLAEIASLIGVAFTAVFSRLDVSEDIKSDIIRFGANAIIIGSEYSLSDLEALAKRHGRTIAYYWTMSEPISEVSSSLFGEALQDLRRVVDGRNKDEEEYPRQRLDSEVHQIDPDYFVEAILPSCVEALRSPLVARILRGEFNQLKNEVTKHIPELENPNTIVAMLCPKGNTSLALSTLLSQLGFGNVCSVKGGLEEILNEEGENGSEKRSSSEFCPLPGSSISASSIDFVKRLVKENPDEYFTFMQYDNIENINAHVLTTGPELSNQISDLDCVICTFGTGGTATGLASYFKRQNRGVKVCVAFPDNPVEGIRTLRGAEGLAFYKPELYDRIVEVDNAKAQQLLKYFVDRGVNIGPSTAIAVQASMELEEEGGSESNGSYAVIAADGIENYAREYSRILSTGHRAITQPSKTTESFSPLLERADP
ncbi:MAG: pyridoxal-phosphate dependent enzyme [Nitrososphaerota archaeon]|nr:pyridoxal-phosphate dependent enzyme [Nitrososphaerota archaeon]